MKPFWISCAVLVSLFIILQVNVRYLNNFIEPLHEQLQEASDLVKQDDWDAAYQLTQQVHDTWHGKELYLHVTLKHSDIDHIYVLLEEVLAYLENRKIGEYDASNQTLISELQLLCEMERMSLQNIL